MASSPWGKVATVEAANFDEIMSEEYAKNLQEKENKKFAGQYTQTMKVTEENDHENPSKVECENFQAEQTKFLEEKQDLVPEDVLKVLREDAAAAAGGSEILSEFCDSDAVIAHLLQSQFDHEYNDELRRIEKKQNKESKVSVSLNKYLRSGHEESDEEEVDFDSEYDRQNRDWDRFETNEKKFDGIPKRGFKIGGEGEMITKHDEQICGVRNACKVMSFPPDFQTGDAAGFEMKLSNAVFNQLKTYSRKGKKNRMHDRKENIATAELGIDGPTRLLLYKLINNQILEQVNGIVSTGKESIILHADSDPNYTGEILPKECAIKIFKTTLNEFKQRDRYIKDDYRFRDRFSKQNHRVIISMWAEKEMHNMMRMQKCGINCPDVVTLKKHVLVMSFIGSNHVAAPKLRYAVLNDAELICAHDEVVDMMHKMYNVAQLVHADLSEYNILWYDGKCWFIDVAQSVEPGHPSALEFLMRDCNNIVSFFSRRGVPEMRTKEELFEHITGLSAQNLSAAQLERIHDRGPTVKESTCPNEEDDQPAEAKPPVYPFELAWETSQAERAKNVHHSQQAPIESRVIESTDALKVLTMTGCN